MIIQDIPHVIRSANIAVKVARMSDVTGMNQDPVQLIASTWGAFGIGIAAPFHPKNSAAVKIASALLKRICLQYFKTWIQKWTKLVGGMRTLQALHIGASWFQGIAFGSPFTGSTITLHLAALVTRFMWWRSVRKVVALLLQEDITLC